MRDALIVSVLSVLPRRRLARCMGGVARARISRKVTRWFVRAYGVDLSEAVVPPGGFPTLEALFVRRLLPGARPVAAEAGAMVSPVDGTCAFAGVVEDGRVPIAPGRTFGLRSLLGEPVTGGHAVVVLYLSPKDYHRVHVPREGRLVRWRYVPGTLWPVFPAAVRRVEGLFARNERVVCALETSEGPLWVALVGAFGVGRIEVVGVPSLTNSGPRVASSGAVSREVGRADELGCFHLGSTVVLVAPCRQWDVRVSAGMPVRVGQRLADAARPA